MKKQETEKKEEAPVVKIEGLEKFKKAEAQVAEMVKKINELEITDETSQKIAYDMVSDANKTVKFVDEIRVKIKEPYLEAGKTIDNAAKLITKPLADAVEAGKKKLLDYDKKVKEEAAAAEMEKKAEEEKIAKEKEATEKTLASIAKIDNWCKAQIETLKVKEEWDAFDRTISSYLSEETKAKAGIHFEKIEKMVSAYKKIVEIKLLIISATAEASPEELEMLKESEALEIEINEKRKKQMEIQSKLEISKAQKIQQAVEQKEESIISAAISPSKSTRKTWKFELVDKSKLIPDWISVDEAAVKEYLSANKESLTDGQVVNGIKFFQAEGVVLR